MGNIKLINENTDLSKLPNPFNWDVMVNGKPYYVVRVEGYVHTVYGPFSGGNEYWAYPRNEKPSYKNLIPFSSSNFGATWGLQYTPYIYLKDRFHSGEAADDAIVLITRNGKRFCQVPARDINYGTDLAKVTIAELQEHPLDLNEINFDKKAIGRKVYFRSMPMIITGWVDGDANIILEPDVGCVLSVPEEFADEMTIEDFFEDNRILTSIMDKNIWWFRK